jgi:hypothetical protein
MTTYTGLIAAIALAWAPTGAAALGASPPPAGGTISIEAKPGDGTSDAAMHVFLDTVSEALTARGFTVFEDQGHAASVLELVVTRGDVGTEFVKAAGQHAASVTGGGVGIALGTGDSQQVSLRRTRLEMRFHRRGETAIVWDGTAVTVRGAGVSKGTDQAVATDLSRALLQAYPVQPTDVIGVP